MPDPSTIDAATAASSWVQAGGVALFAFAVLLQLRDMKAAFSASMEKMVTELADTREALKAALENLRFLTPPRGLPIQQPPPVVDVMK